MILKVKYLKNVPFIFYSDFKNKKLRYSSKKLTMNSSASGFFYPTDLAVRILKDSKWLIGSIGGTCIGCFVVAKTHLINFFEPQVRWVEKFFNNLEN